MPFLGANRTALIAAFGPQGPDFFNSVTFPMTMALLTQGEVPSFSVQRNDAKFAITNTNFSGAFVAGEVNTADRTGWERYASTSIYTLRLPTDWFADHTGGNWHETTWRVIDDTITFNENHKSSLNNGFVVFDYSGEGVFVDTKNAGDPGTVLPATLENRWISIIFARGERTSFLNYTNAQNEGTYAVRVHIRDAVTGELLFARDSGSFNGTQEWLDDLPDFVTYNDVITSGESNNQDTLNWRADGMNLGTDYTGNVDVAQCWWAPGSFIDPAVNVNWVSNAIPTEIEGYTAWIHGTFQTVASTGVPEVTGFTHISCSSDGLVTQPDDVILTAGNENTAQYAFTNTVYPGA